MSADWRLNWGSGRHCDFESSDEAEELARRSLPRTLFNSVAFGAELNRTNRWNVAAYDSVTFRPRVAAEWGKRILGTSVLGTPISMPIIVAPMGSLRTVHPAGDLAMASAASAHGTMSVLSMQSGHSIAEVGAHSSGSMWQQLYLNRGRDYAEDVIAQAKAVGSRALVVTMDISVLSTSPYARRRPRAVTLGSAVRFAPEVVIKPRWLAGFVRDGMFLSAPRAEPGGRQWSATWSDMKWIRECWGGPLVVKGIVTAEDAHRAVAEGASAVVVSNHGGHALDGTPATLAALPEVAAAVGGEVEVLCDGGVRRGSDVVKAIALGARAVLVGRPFLWSLALGGERGVMRMFEVFRTELDRTLALLGCRSVAEVDQSYIAFSKFCAMHSSLGSRVSQLVERPDSSDEEGGAMARPGHRLGTLSGISVTVSNSDANGDE
jgi:isopentenyl diphosphate isomerase/L-lactate dehydrogenase-like FMN-dependent dehydrogenase